MSTVMDRPDRHAIARMVGLGRGKMVALATTSIISTLGAVAMGLLLYHEVKTDGDRVERYMVYLDPNSNVVKTSNVGGDFIVTERILRDFAPRYIRYIRQRLPHAATMAWQRRQAGLATDPKLRARLGQLIRENDEVLGASSVDIMPGMTANVVKMDSPNEAIVIVDWKERINKGVAKELPWTATLTIASRAPPKSIVFDENPLGLYVVELTMSRAQKS